MLNFRLPPPPKMNREKYRRYRVRLVVMAVAWIAFAIICLFLWQEIPMYVKGLISILGWVFVPDVSMLEQIFTSYDCYDREGR
jgi:hypothetical protein